MGSKARESAKSMFLLLSFLVGVFIYFFACFCLVLVFGHLFCLVSLVGFMLLFCLIQGDKHVESLCLT